MDAEDTSLQDTVNMITTTIFPLNNTEAKKNHFQNKHEGKKKQPLK